MGCGASAASKYAIAESSGASPTAAPDWLAQSIWTNSKGSKVPINESTCMQHRLLKYPQLSDLKNDFEQSKILGRGKFGEVLLIKSKDDNKYYAVKNILKSTIYVRKMLPSVENEICTLLRIRHPFILHCFGYAQDEKQVSMIIEYCSGGELFNRLRRARKFSNDEGLFYFAEISSALNFLHSNSILYRDLKPENVMLDYAGHVRLVDFGFAVKLSKSDEEIHGQNCGTAMYVAPEIASGKKGAHHGLAVDWWAAGVLLYEMLVGSAPFGDSADLTKFEILNRINSGKIKYPGYLTKDSKELIAGLLITDPSRRHNFENVKTSNFIKKIDLNELLHKRITPPWIPAKTSDVPDTTNFLDWKQKKKQMLDEEAKDEKAYSKSGEGAGYVGERAVGTKKRSEATSIIATLRSSLVACRYRPFR